jgi:hypothetical protein
MSCFSQLGSFGNKRRLFLLIMSYELAQEAKRGSTMQNGFSGLFTQPLTSSLLTLETLPLCFCAESSPCLDSSCLKQ